jgi:hypothetical protein
MLNVPIVAFALVATAAANLSVLNILALIAVHSPLTQPSAPIATLTQLVVATSGRQEMDYCSLGTSTHHCTRTCHGGNSGDGAFIWGPGLSCASPIARQAMPTDCCYARTTSPVQRHLILQVCLPMHQGEPPEAHTCRGGDSDVCAFIWSKMELCVSMGLDAATMAAVAVVPVRRAASTASMAAILRSTAAAASTRAASFMDTPCAYGNLHAVCCCHCEALSGLCGTQESHVKGPCDECQTGLLVHQQSTGSMVDTVVHASSKSQDAGMRLKKHECACMLVAHAQRLSAHT